MHAPDTGRPGGSDPAAAPEREDRREGERGGPRDHYTSRSGRFADRADQLSRRSRRLSHVRIAVFVALVAIGLWLERGGSAPALAALATGLAAFIVLVVMHQRVRADERWCRDMASLNGEGLQRLARNWDALPIRAHHAGAGGPHTFAGDLDLFGRASLVQVLGPVGSAPGAATLDAWLLHGADPHVVRERQDAVRELTGEHELRDALAIRGRRTRAVRQADIERFLAWAERGESIRPGPLLTGLAWLLPLATWLLIVLQATGVLGSALWLLPLLAAFVVYVLAAAGSRRIFDDAFGREGMFTAYPELLRTAAEARLHAPLLRDIGARLRTTGEPAHSVIARLRSIMHLADVRFSITHLPLYLFTMWDVHLLRALDAWRRRAGRDVRGWLTATGELEALSSLATLAHDQPDWCFAHIEPGAGILRAEQLGHPLLSDEVRVCNDVELGPPGTFLLVTGSNMSGKSTLLRAVGLNVVLAQAGGPSCARSLHMPPLEVQTSIRVQDSLARGVSYFMAELERLKQIVDAAHRVAAGGQSILLFLLDEILHGTNTAERRIAARRVIRHLVDSGAIGAVTTHDLELAEEPILAPVARLVHFQERFDDRVDGTRLDFDYRLRSGLATSTNALALMKLVGLPGADAEQPEA